LIFGAPYQEILCRSVDFDQGIWDLVFDIVHEAQFLLLACC
jgi:hypothetical protein